MTDPPKASPPLSSDWWPHLVEWARSRGHRPLPARGALKEFRVFCAARGFTGVPEGFAADAALREQYEGLKPWPSASPPPTWSGFAIESEPTSSA